MTVSKDNDLSLRATNSAVSTASVISTSSVRSARANVRCFGMLARQPLTYASSSCEGRASLYAFAGVPTIQ